MHVEVSDWAFTREAIDTAGLRTTAYPSYQTDLTKTEDELFSGMTSACRRCLRKAEKTGVRIEHATDAGFADEFYDQLEDVCARQRIVPLYDRQRVRSLVKHLGPTGRVLFVRARDPDGRCIATGIYPGLNEVAYFWGNAS